MWHSEDIVKATAGALTGNAFDAASVCIDSRSMEKGALFLALEGDRVDGHDYVSAALANGAAAALVHRLPENIPHGASLIAVGNTADALTELAKAARRRSAAKIIAVTGSVGKTGLKEALRAALSPSGKTFATQGNLNNHIGLPLSLANLPQDAAYGVFELGMNHAGEIAALTRIAAPDIAVITNVEAVHLEFFKDVEGIALAKAEIFEGLQEDGAAVLNRDNGFYALLRGQAAKRGIRRIMTFGEHEEADCRLMRYSIENHGSQIEAMIAGTGIVYRLGTIGRHWALTSLAALAAATLGGADLADAAAAFAHFHEPEGRGRMHRARGVTVIDDSYNASPVSVAAGLAKLEEMGLAGKSRKIAVLGDMLELGTSSAELHRQLLAPLKEHGIELVFAAGTYMKLLYDSLPPGMRGGYAATSRELAPMVANALKEGDIALIKGSHGSRMDIVRDALLAPSPQPVREPIHAV